MPIASTLCSKKSDAKIEITITTTNLIRIKYSSFNYRLSGANVANFNKIHCTVFEQQLLKNVTQKQKFPIWKSHLSSSYTILSVTVCAQNGRHLHRHIWQILCYHFASHSRFGTDFSVVRCPCSLLDITPPKSFLSIIIIIMSLVQTVRSLLLPDFLSDDDDDDDDET